MKKVLAFSSRNFKELLRDPLSYIFCLGFPLIMLIIMSVINESIPPEANMTLFRIENLAGGIAVFGLSFVMLFTTLTVSKDRSGAFLVRLYATPMNSADFIAGYALPCLLLAVLQSVISFAASLVVASVSGSGSLTVGGSLLLVLTLIPGAVFFIAAGVLFGAESGLTAKRQAALSGTSAGRSRSTTALRRRAWLQCWISTELAYIC